MAIVIMVTNQSVTIIKGIFFLIMTLILFIYNNVILLLINDDSLTEYKKEILMDQTSLKNVGVFNELLSFNYFF